MPDNAINNPLRRYFRQPAIYIKLPSDGNFYPEGSLDMPPNRELPVYPMTAMDEITYRTADALFNGSAVVNVIKSCVPNIKDPWQVPNVDIDTILIGMRIASFGHEMPFDSTCPHCANENSFGLDLRTLLDNIKAPDYNSTVDVGDMQIFFRPLSYLEANKNNLAQFEDQKLLEVLPNTDMSDDEKMRLINQAFLKLSKLTIDAIAKSISLIKVGDEMVMDPAYIEDFVSNCDRDIFNKIRDRIVSIKEETELKPIKVSCQHHECQQPYETPFTLDVANFFASAS